MSTSNVFPAPSHTSPKLGEPAWDLALMFPLQGHWSVEDYLRLDAGLLVEYADGFIRVLPMPSPLHQWIVQFLFRRLDDLVSQRNLGHVFLAPLPVALSASKYREPDITFVRPSRLKSWKGQPTGADLVMEVVSEGQENWTRDYVEKRSDYAAAGIPEYWIVDPQPRRITVLTLAEGEYREHGVFGMGDVASSALLAGFACHVSEVFAKCDETEMT